MTLQTLVLVTVGLLITTSVHATTLTVSPYDDLVCSYFVNECPKALRVMFCESSNNPRATSSGNYGLFQINQIHGHSINDLYDPEYNIQVAFNLYQRRGWQPWIHCGG